MLKAQTDFITCDQKIDMGPETRMTGVCIATRCGDGDTRIVMRYHLRHSKLLLRVLSHKLPSWIVLGRPHELFTPLLVRCRGTGPDGDLHDGPGLRHRMYRRGYRRPLSLPSLWAKGNVSDISGPFTD